VLRKACSTPKLMGYVVASFTGVAYQDGTEAVILQTHEIVS
jgi:hypothetical protein